MAQSEVVFVIVAGLCLLAITAYVTQKLDSHRQLQRNLKYSLNQEIAQLDHLLNNIPSVLMTEPLYRLLTTQLKQYCQQKALINNDPQSQKDSEWIDQIIQKGFQKTAPPSTLTLLEDEQQVSSATQAIIELAKWLNQQKEPHANMAHELLHYCKQCLETISIDKMLFDAIRCEQEKGAQVAIHQFRNCLVTLENQPHLAQNDLQLYKIRTYIDQLEQLIFEQKTNPTATKTVDN